MTAITIPVSLASPLASGDYRQKEWTLDTFTDLAASAPVLEKDPRSVPGVFVGTLRAPRATAENVVEHTAVVLDLDQDVPHDVPERLRRQGWDSVVHTTASHTAERPRLRVIIAIDRPVHPGAYPTLVKWAAEKLGVIVDPSAMAGCHRFFLPHIIPGSNAELFGVEVHRINGDPIEVDSVLNSAPMFNQGPADSNSPKHRTRRDPLQLPGAAGAFNRTYSMEEAIEEFQLPYRPCGNGFIHIDSTQTQPGLTPVNEDRTLWFDHAGTSPTHGQTMSVFDLVAEWRHGLQTGSAQDDQDKPPAERRSRALMGVDAAQIPAVAKEMAAATFDAGPQPDGPLTIEACEAALSPRNPKTGKRALTDAKDRQTLVDMDPMLASRAISAMGRRPGWRVKPDWASESELFEQEARRLGLYPDQDEDEAAVQQYLGKHYGGDVPSISTVRELLSLSASQPGREIDPLTSYLDRLEWDGVPRLSGGAATLQEVLPGVDRDDEDERRWASRAVMRACVAAVARAYRPGWQVDSSLVLVGPQGTRKTSWVRWLAGPWAAPLPDILGGDADLFDPCHKAWIVEADEGFAVTRSGSRYGDALKRFLTARSDTWRPKYGRTSRTMGRRFVVWGTTNHEDFLANEEGNRRYWPVRIVETIPTTFLTPERRDQIWAEAVVLFKRGESTWLSDEEEQVMQAARAERATEEDPLVGPVYRYIMTPRPRGHAWMGKVERETAMLVKDPTWTPQPVSAATLMVDLKDELPQRVNVRAVTATMRALGWEPQGQVADPRGGGSRLSVWAQPGLSH